jgi:hypothetical protein
MDSLRKLAEGISAVFSSGSNDYKTRKSIIEGFLTKRALKSGVNWDKRYFILYPDGELAYFLSVDSETPRGVMKLNSDFFVSDHSSMALGFLISDMETVYYLRADSAEEKMYWMHTVARVLRQLSADAGTPMETAPIMTPEIDEQIVKYGASRPVSVRVASLARASLAPPLQPQVPVAAPESQTANAQPQEAVPSESESKPLQEAVDVAAPAEPGPEPAPAAVAEEAAVEPQPVPELEQVLAAPVATLEPGSAPVPVPVQTSEAPVLAPTPPQAVAPESRPESATGTGGISNLTKMWQSKANAHTDTQARNPFREGGGAAAARAPRPGDADYGRAAAGSQTAERAAKAQDWVEQEIAKLLSVIREIGENRPDGQAVVKFGPLFYAYQDISDTLVGIMMRAKKRKLISYPGDMLFQGVHNEVEIFVVDIVTN